MLMKNDNKIYTINKYLTKKGAFYIIMAFSLLTIFTSCKPNINPSSSVVSNNSSNMVSSELLSKVSTGSNLQTLSSATSNNIKSAISSSKSSSQGNISSTTSCSSEIKTLSSNIRIRDPFILCEKGVYYLYGTTDENVWEGKADGFNAYTSTDLESWSGPYTVFKSSADFWADQNFWAPEVHRYKDNYYMFASFKADNICRGTQILKSNSPLGPFIPISDKPITPNDWECLDGTFWVEKGIPYIIFCHEWVQVNDGEICVMPLSEDLKTPLDNPTILFRASEAPWTIGNNWNDNNKYNIYITDGPFIYQSTTGSLIMIWSSVSKTGYAIGQAVSENGIYGPWRQIEKPIFEKDGGHGMIFKSLNNELILTIHCPNNTPFERPVFFKIEEKNDEIKLWFV